MSSPLPNVDVRNANVKSADFDAAARKFRAPWERAFEDARTGTPSQIIRLQAAKVISSHPPGAARGARGEIASGEHAVQPRTVEAANSTEWRSAPVPGPADRSNTADAVQRPHGVDGQAYGVPEDAPPGFGTTDAFGTAAPRSNTVMEGTPAALEQFPASSAASTPSWVGIDGAMGSPTSTGSNKKLLTFATIGGAAFLLLFVALWFFGSSSGNTTGADPTPEHVNSEPLTGAGSDKPEEVPVPPAAAPVVVPTPVAPAPVAASERLGRDPSDDQERPGARTASPSRHGSTRHASRRSRRPASRIRRAGFVTRSPYSR